MTAFNVRALGTLVTVAGNALSKRLTQVLGALVSCLESRPNGELETAIEETFRALLSSIGDAEGLNSLMLILLDWYVIRTYNIEYLRSWQDPIRQSKASCQRFESVRHFLWGEQVG
jgi:hypothetical protein